MYQYGVNILVFLSLEAINLYLILPNVMLLVSPPSISLIWFRTRIIGNRCGDKQQQPASVGYRTLVFYRPVIP
jgi:hypothetical protein